MAFDELRSGVAKLESDITSSPIVPMMTPEIPTYFASRSDFTKPLALRRYRCRCRVGGARDELA